MFPLVPSIITGGGGLLGSLFSSSTSGSNNAANIQMQRETNQMQIQEAQKNRDFQEQMSNTAYRRASTDMTAAGLNPAAMFGSGSAASSPGGAQATVTAPQAKENPGRPFEALGDIVGKAFSSAQTVKNLDLMQAQEDKTRSEEHLNDTRVLATRQETINNAVREGILGHEKGKAEADKIVRQNDAITAKNEAEINSGVRKAGDVSKWTARVGQELTDLVGTGLSSALRARQFKPQRTTRETTTHDTEGRGSSRFEETFRNY